MSKRLQVLFENEEYLEIQAAARQSRMTVSEWVRQALRRARNHHPATIETKLAAVAEAESHSVRRSHGDPL